MLEQLKGSNKYISILFFATFILAIYTNDKSKFFITFIMLTTIAVNVLFVVLNRAMLRVVIPEYILGTAIMLYLTKYKKQEDRKEIYGIIAIIILLSITFCGDIYNFEYDFSSYKNYQDIIEYTNSHKENTYLYTAPAMQFRYLAYPVYTMPPKGAFSNLRVMGGWDIFTQNYYDFKQRNNLEGTFLDLLKDNVYLIDGDVNWSGTYYKNYKKNIIEFIEKHYGKNVKCEKIKTFENIYIYKLTEDNIN